MQRPGRYFAHAQNDLNLSNLHMFEDTFSLDMVYIKDGYYSTTQ